MYICIHIVTAPPTFCSHTKLTVPKHKTDLYMTYMYTCTHMDVALYTPPPLKKFKNSPSRWKPLYIHVYIDMYVCMYTHIHRYVYMYVYTPVEIDEHV